MKVSQTSCFGFGSVLAIVMVAITANLASAQKQPLPPALAPPELVKRLNADTDLAIKEAESIWRKKFAACRDPDDMKEWVSRLVSLQNKFENVGGFLGLGTSASERARTAFHIEVIDESDLILEMKDFLNETLEGLRLQDQALMKRMGLSIGSQRALHTPIINTTSWDRAFDRLFQTAGSLSETDMARLAGSIVGSNLASDAVTDFARESGLNPNKDGSAADFFTDLLINIAVGLAVDAATSPVEPVTNRLVSEIQAVEQVLLNGPNGLLTVLRSAAEQHKQARLKLVGGQAKGGGITFIGDSK